MDADLGDLPCSLESHGGPGLAGVRRFVNPIAVRAGLISNRRFPHPHINHIRIGKRHRHRADGACIEGPVGDVVPRLPGTLRLPDAAAAGTHVVDIGLARHTGGGGGPAAAIGAYIAPLQGLQECRIVLIAGFVLIAGVVAVRPGASGAVLVDHFKLSRLYHVLYLPRHHGTDQRYRR